MNPMAFSASRPLRLVTFVSGFALALFAVSSTSTLRAAPPADPWSLAFGEIGVDEQIYSFHSAPGKQTGNDFTVGGSATFTLDPQYSLQFDASYSRISPGGGIPGSNGYSIDAHLQYHIDDIPVGVFTGAFKNGPTTWGGGLEGSLPFAKLNLPLKDLTPSSDPVLNWQGYYARTHNTGVNHFGGTGELRLYPCDETRVSLHLGYQHTSSSFAGVNFSDNIWSFGMGGGYMLPCSWILFADYEHTHFNRSGLGVDGFTLGAHYCFGGKKKIRDAEPRYLDFSHLLGVQAKF